MKLERKAKLYTFGIALFVLALILLSAVAPQSFIFVLLFVFVGGLLFMIFYYIYIGILEVLHEKESDKEKSND